MAATTTRGDVPLTKTCVTSLPCAPLPGNTPQSVGEQTHTHAHIHAAEASTPASPGDLADGVTNM